MWVCYVLPKLGLWLRKKHFWKEPVQFPGKSLKNGRLWCNLPRPSRNGGRGSHFGWYSHNICSRPHYCQRCWKYYSVSWILRQNDWKTWRQTELVLILFWKKPYIKINDGGLFCWCQFQETISHYLFIFLENDVHFVEKHILIDTIDSYEVLKNFVKSWLFFFLVRNISWNQFVNRIIHDFTVC